MTEVPLAQLFAEAPRTLVEPSSVLLNEVTFEIEGQQWTFYTGDYSAELTHAYDLNTFRGIHGSSFGDHSLEVKLAPFVVLPVALQHAVGIRQADYQRAQTLIGGDPGELSSQIALQTLYQVALPEDGGKVLFPTPLLFDAFGILPKRG